MNPIIYILNVVVYGIFSAVGLGAYPEVAGYIAVGVFWLIVANLISWVIVVVCLFLFITRGDFGESMMYPFGIIDIADKSRLIKVATYVGMSAIISLTGIVLLFVVYIIQALGAFLLKSSGEPWFVPVGLVMAWLLYVMRERLLYIYAVLEILVGIAAVTSSVYSSSTADKLAHLMAVSGGVYIIVRGLDNFNKSLPDLEAILPERTGKILRDRWEFMFKFHKPKATDLS